MMALEIMSSGIQPGDAIADIYTCDSNSVSPELRWSNIPSDTQELALIVDDPDAPRGVFAHWVVYNISPSTDHFEVDAGTGGTLPGGAVQGQNGFGRNRYDGPCPPAGPEHRYYFRLFALDTRLGLPPGATRAVVFDAMQGHIIETSEFFGRYSRKPALAR